MNNPIRRTSAWGTIPNWLCLLRLVGSLGFLPLAAYGESAWVFVLFLVLTITDWLDGKLARWLDQRSTIGPRLDSFADAMMYGCLALSLVVLRDATMMAEIIWIAAGLLSYALASAYSLVKFGCMPSYHTRSAKFSWLVVALAAICILVAAIGWPLRIAMTCVTIANLESVALTWRLNEPRSDVRSVFDLKSTDVR